MRFLFISVIIGLLSITMVNAQFVDLFFDNFNDETVPPWDVNPAGGWAIRANGVTFCVDDAGDDCLESQSAASPNEQAWTDISTIGYNNITVVQMFRCDSLGATEYYATLVSDGTTRTTIYNTSIDSPGCNAVKNNIRTQTPSTFWNKALFNLTLFCSPHGGTRKCNVDNVTIEGIPFPPTISSIVEQVEDNAANISWTTDLNSNGTVEYGLTDSLGSQVINTSFLTSRKIRLTSLLDGRLYFYNLTSCSNVNAQCNTDGPFNFTTIAVPPSVFDVRPQSGDTFATTDTITISANVTDNTAVDSVFANVTLYNGSIQRIELLKFGVTDKYNNTFTLPGVGGVYSVRYIANDTSNNINSTVTTSFNVNGTALLTLTTDNPTYGQGTSATNNPDFSIQFFIQFVARLIDSLSFQPIPTAVCNVTSNHTDSVVDLTYGSILTNYTGNLSTVGEFGLTQYTATCKAPNYPEVTNVTTAQINLQAYLIETRNISFGSITNNLDMDSTWLSKKAPSSSVAVRRDYNLTLNVGQENISVAKIRFCGSNTNVNCSFLKDFSVDAPVFLRANVSASANNACDLKICYMVENTNLNTIIEFCPSPTDIGTASTIVNQNVSPSNSPIDQGHFLGIHLKCDADPLVVSPTNINVSLFYNYTGEPITIEMENFEVLQLITVVETNQQVNSSFTINPNSNISVEIDNIFNFTNINNDPRFKIQTHSHEVKSQFKPSIIPLVNRVLNSTGQLWASDNASLSPPKTLTISNDVSTWETESIPANSSKEENLIVTHEAGIRDSENLILSTVNRKTWTANITSIFNSEITLDNVTVITNYSTYNVPDDFNFFAYVTNSSGTFNITSSIVINSSLNRITLPKMSLESTGLSYEIDAIAPNFAPTVTAFDPTDLTLQNSNINFTASFFDRNEESLNWTFNQSGTIVASGSDSNGNGTASFFFSESIGSHTVVFRVTDGTLSDQIQWNISVVAGGGGGGGGGGGIPPDTKIQTPGNVTTLGEQLLETSLLQRGEDLLNRIGALISPKSPLLGAAVLLVLLWAVLYQGGPKPPTFPPVRERRIREVSAIE